MKLGRLWLSPTKDSCRALMNPKLAGNKHAWKHGWFGTSEYQTWADMIRRCGCPRSHNYKHYGGRGIAVCDEWKSFVNFIRDMGPRPSPELTIERRDNDGNYTPDNCYWGTKKEQSRNRRISTFYTHDGHTRCLAEWSDLSGIPPDTLSWRISAGWDFGKAITRPLRPQRNNRLTRC